MNYKIISDSSSNLLATEAFPYASVAMHIRIGNRDWMDSAGTDVDSMSSQMYAEAEKSSTACPAPGQWLEAFGEAEEVFCVTITHQLSGSYDSAMAAKSIYEEEFPQRHVYVIDSLGTGPRMLLLIDCLRILLESGMNGEEAYRQTIRYRDETDLLFVLESVQNFVRNGRINPLLAKAINVLNMRIIGTASTDGKLKVLSKARGSSRAIEYVANYMKEHGYCGGRIIIAHHQNTVDAESLCCLLKERFGKVPVEIQKTTALCSYYAEKGGLLIGFEKQLQAGQDGCIRELIRSFIEAKKRTVQTPRGIAALKSR